MWQKGKHQIRHFVDIFGVQATAMKLSQYRDRREVSSFTQSKAKKYSAVSKGKIARPLERNKQTKKLDEPVIDPQLLLHCKHRRKNKKEKK